MRFRLIVYLVCLSALLSIDCRGALLYGLDGIVEISEYEFVTEGMSFRILDEDAHEVALIDRHDKFHIEDFGAYGDLKEVPATVEYQNETYRVVALIYTPCVFSKELTLPNTIEEISGSFHSTDWTQFSFPNSLKTIGNSCVQDCNNLTEITLPQSLRSIGAYCFVRNEKLEKVNFGRNLRIIGSNSFCNNPNLTAVELPNSLTSIGNGSFFQCKNLKYVKLPRWLPYEYQSFSKDLEIFNGCAAIKVIEWESETPVALTNCFRSVKKAQCTVIVPDGCKDVYMENEYWKQFNIVEKSNYASSVEEIESPEETSSPAYYLINGIQVASEDDITAGQPYIKVEGEKSTKLIK